MFEALKGINIADPKFLVPVLIVVALLFVVARVAKKMLKLGLLVIVIALAAVVYFNLPSLKVDGSTAVLKVSGHEYRINTKDVKLESEKQDDRVKVFLVSGNTKIELPFNREYAQKFILDKIKAGVN